MQIPCIEYKTPRNWGDPQKLDFWGSVQTAWCLTFYSAYPSGLFDCHLQESSHISSSPLSAYPAKFFFRFCWVCITWCNIARSSRLDLIWNLFSACFFRMLLPYQVQSIRFLFQDCKLSLLLFLQFSSKLYVSKCKVYYVDVITYPLFHPVYHNHSPNTPRHSNLPTATCVMYGIKLFGIPLDSLRLFRSYVLQLDWSNEVILRSILNLLYEDLLKSVPALILTIHMDLCTVLLGILLWSVRMQDLHKLLQKSWR